jgi:hypothetical protein
MYSYRNESAAFEVWLYNLFFFVFVFRRGKISRAFRSWQFAMVLYCNECKRLNNKVFYTLRRDNIYGCFYNELC